MTHVMIDGEPWVSLRKAQSWLADYDRENDSLRRENERLLKALAQRDQSPPTERGTSGAQSEMCCGGTTVRAVCRYHGGGA